MSNVRIMVVEDDRLLMMYITDSLKKLNYDVAGVASTAEDAIAQVIKLQPDLVLTDIVLADDGGDGVDVASYVHTNLDLPVVFLTSCDDEATLQRAKITEPYGYLLKPFNERELHTTIEMALYKHRMERKLKESEQWFATTLKSIGDAVIATDKDGLIKFMNPVAEVLTGWKQMIASGKDLREVFRITTDNDDSVHPLNKVLSNGFTLLKTNHATLTARDGNIIYVDYAASPIMVENMLVNGIVLTFRDITDQKIMTEKLKKSQAKYRSLFMNLNDAFAYYRVIADENGRPIDYAIVTVNDAFERITGLSRDYVIDKRITEVLPGIETLSFDWIGTLGTVALTGKGITFEQCMDLTGRWYTVSAYSPEKDHFAIIFTDITQRKKMEENLRRERDTVKSIFESSADAIVIFDINGHVIDCNQAILDLHRYDSKMELLGRSQFTMVAPEDHETIATLVSKLDAEGIVRNLPVTITTKDNMKVPVELSSSVLRDFTGKPIGYVGIVKERTKTLA